MKKYLFLIIVSSLVLAGCGNKAENKVENKAESKLSSIKDLLGMGSEQMCEWSTESEGVKSEGKLWIKDGKFRQTIINQIDNEPETRAEVISDGEWFYMWNPNSKEQGMKMKMEEDDKEAMGEIENGSFDWGKEFNYKCKPANVSGAEFTPPTDVTFLDLNALQQDFSKLIPSGVEMPESE